MKDIIYGDVPITPGQQLARDLSLLSSLISTGNDAGADINFFKEIAYDRVLFRRLVQLVMSPTKEDPLLAPRLKLQSAIDKGVKCENETYQFFDPGMSLEALFTFYELQKKITIGCADWCKKYDWWKQEDSPQERTIKKFPVECRHI